MTRPEAMTTSTDGDSLGYVALDCLRDTVNQPDQVSLNAGETLFEQSAQVETIAPSAAMTYVIISVRSDLPDGGFKLDDIELSKEDE